MKKMNFAHYFLITLSITLIFFTQACSCAKKDTATADQTLGEPPAPMPSATTEQQETTKKSMEAVQPNNALSQTNSTVKTAKPSPDKAAAVEGKDVVKPTQNAKADSSSKSLVEKNGNVVQEQKKQLQPTAPVKMVDLSADELEPADVSEMKLKRQIDGTKDFELLLYWGIGANANKFKSTLKDTTPIGKSSGYKNGFYLGQDNWAVEPKSINDYSFTLERSEFLQNRLGSTLSDDEWLSGIFLKVGSRFWSNKKLGVSAEIAVSATPMGAVGDWTLLGMFARKSQVFDTFTSAAALGEMVTPGNISDGMIYSEGVTASKTSSRKIIRDSWTLDSVSVDAEMYGIEALCNFDFRVWKKLQAFIPVGVAWNHIRTDGSFRGTIRGLPCSFHEYDSETGFSPFLGFGLRYDMSNCFSITLDGRYYFDSPSPEIKTDKAAVKVERDYWYTSFSADYRF